MSWPQHAPFFHRTRDLLELKMPTLRTTHTYALLEVSAVAYDEIKQKLTDADYTHTFGSDGEIDMSGIALIREQESPKGQQSERG